MRVFLLCLLPLAACGQTARPLADEPMVDLHKVDPSIVIELRYATARNVTGQPIYPPTATCFIREGVAQRLRAAQYLLQQQGFGLKIWDAYRPEAAQRQLFDFIKRPEFVADPAKGGALHTWGVAVDATLVDAKGNDVSMPTDFDVFNTEAALRYTGRNSAIARNLDRLQRAMSAGFFGMHGEWWHFVAKNWADYGPVRESTPFTH